MKILIDTDPGVDDAMAVFYAALAPEIELVGLTTIFGNVPVEIATRNALRLIEMAGLAIPVAQGASKPLVLPLNPPPDFIHGAEGFGAVPATLPKGAAIGESAAAFMCRLARENPGELVICAIGPITNLAEAIQLDPEFARNIKKIVFMGGAALVPGNVTPFAEANTHNDPHALNIVIGSGAEVVMVGLDVTMQVLCDAAFFAQLAQTSPQLGGFLKRASGLYLDFYRQEMDQDGCALHDPSAVIACTHPELFDMQSLSIHVTESGVELGRTAVDETGNAPNIKVCVGGEMDSVKARFESVFRPQI